MGKKVSNCVDLSKLKNILLVLWYCANIGLISRCCILMVDCLIMAEIYRIHLFCNTRLYIDGDGLQISYLMFSEEN